MSSQIAINPLPWILDATTGFHLDRPSLTAAFGAVSSIGFTAVQADVPADFSTPEYLDFISSYRLAPAPSYFGADFENERELPETLDRARKHARTQIELGNNVTFIAGNLSPERRARPAASADHDPDRLKAVIAGLEATAQIFADAGLTAGLHPHVGSWIETEEEIRTVLDSIPSDTLGFGPDTGHLAWAGMEPQYIMSDYSARIVGVHIKDVDPIAAAAAKDHSANYTVATETFHVWTEPGQGSVQFDRVFDALPSTFGGWFILEVDVPNHGDATESSRLSAEWIASQDRFAGSLR
jgi:inosose dehydratase